MTKIYFYLDFDYIPIKITAESSVISSIVL